MRGNDFNHSYGNCSVDCFFLWRWNERSNEWSNTTFMITGFACTINAIEKNKKK